MQRLNGSVGGCVDLEFVLCIVVLSFCIACMCPLLTIYIYICMYVDILTFIASSSSSSDLDLDPSGFPRPTTLQGRATYSKELRILIVDMRVSNQLLQSTVIGSKNTPGP